MQNVGQTRIENQTDMVVVQGIEHLATFAARLHQICRTQNAQLVAHHGLFQVQLFGNVIHRNFARKHQMNNADTRGIAKELEKFREFEQNIQGNIVFRFFDILTSIHIFIYTFFTEKSQEKSPDLGPFFQGKAIF